MEQASRPKAAGLKWRRRKGAPDVPVWVAREEAVRSGYPVKTVNLASLAHDERLLIARCHRLQAEMQLWLSGNRGNRVVFDRTFGTLIDTYLSDPESPYRKLKASSRHPYDIYAKKLKAHVGERRIDACDGRDVTRWFKVWAGGVDDLRDPSARLPAARFAYLVLKEAVSWGVVCRLPGCAEFQAILRQLEFPSLRPRSQAPSAEQVTAARRAAHAAGRPSRALAYALQFETTLRQWDVIGEWVPLSDLRPSAVLGYGMKWIGPTWAHVDDKLVLRVTPTKTEDTTAVAVAFDLKLCPMAVEELQAIAVAQPRQGPLVVDERTGLPYRYNAFKDGWLADFKAAGIPRSTWNRDLRAGGVTEGGKAGAALDDRAKVAGHTNLRTTARVYDRDTLEAHRRVARARSTHRSRNDAGT